MVWKNEGPMKYLFILAIILIMNLDSIKAHDRSIFNDDLKIKTHKYKKGDIIEVNCDTVMVMNIKTFEIYKNYYEQGKSSKSLTWLIQLTNEKIDSLQNRHIFELNEDFDSLKNDLNKISEKTEQLIMQSNGKIQDINNNLIDAKLTIDSANSSVEKIRVDFNKLIVKNMWLSVGGIATGVAACALSILLISNYH